jgi:hypothetical protein
MAQDKEAELASLFEKLDQLTEHGQHSKALKLIEQSERGHTRCCGARPRGIERSGCVRLMHCAMRRTLQTAVRRATSPGLSWEAHYWRHAPPAPQRQANLCTCLCCGRTAPSPQAVPRGRGRAALQGGRPDL